MNYKSEDILTNESMGASFTSSPIRLIRTDGVAISTVFTGSPVGKFQIEVSNDTAQDPEDVTNWDIDTTSEQEINGAGTGTFNYATKCKWVRLAYVRTSGTGLCSASSFIREIYR